VRERRRELDIVRIEQRFGKRSFWIASQYVDHPGLRVGVARRGPQRAGNNDVAALELAYQV
jgi:hypothetical protein